MSPSEKHFLAANLMCSSIHDIKQQKSVIGTKPVRHGSVLMPGEGKQANKEKTTDNKNKTLSFCYDSVKFCFLIFKHSYPTTMCFSTVT